MKFLRKIFGSKPERFNMEVKNSFSPTLPATWSNFILCKKDWPTREAAIRSILENNPNWNYGDLIWHVVNDLTADFPNVNIEKNDLQLAENIRCKSLISMQDRIAHVRYYKIGSQLYGLNKDHFIEKMRIANSVSSLIETFVEVEIKCEGEFKISRIFGLEEGLRLFPAFLSGSAIEVYSRIIKGNPALEPWLDRLAIAEESLHASKIVMNELSINQEYTRENINKKLNQFSGLARKQTIDQLAITKFITIDGLGDTAVLRKYIW